MQKFLRFLMLAALFLPFALRAQVSLPLSMDFEDASSLSQWTLTNCVSTTGRTTSQAHESTACFGFHWTTSPSQFLISPEFDAASGTEAISFWYKTTSDYYTESFEVGFSSTTNDTTAFTWSTAVNIPTSISWTEYTLPVPAGTKYVAIKSSAYDAYYLYIDDIYIGDAPTCFKVTNLAINAAQTTSSSLTLTWADTINSGATYTVYDMSDNTIIETGLTANTYTVNNLAANTVYTFGVEANCSATDASLILTVSGRTACGALSELPFNEDFESIPSGSYQMPYCWNRYSSAYTSTAVYPYTYSGYAHSGSHSLYYYGTTGSTYSDTMMAIMPELDVTLFPMNGNRVTFWAKMGSTSYNKNVYVYTMTNPADITTLTLVDSVLVSGTTHTLYSVSLADANANDPYVALMVLKGNGSMYIDDVTLEEIPSCFEVSNVTVSDITSSTVTISWVDANNSGASYTIYNMADTTIIADFISDTTYIVDNLDANTNYTFGVQANCATGDGAIMTVSCRTACGTETFPWSENFDNWTTKSDCWSFMSGALSTTPTLTTNSSAWTLSSSYGSYITIDGKALAMNLYNTLKYWAITPPVDITSDDAVLSVDVAVSAWSSATPNYDNNDTLAFLISTDGGTTFTILQVLDGTQLNNLDNSYTTIFIPVTNYSGQAARFAIYGGSISGTSPYDNRIAIDNVYVGEAPTCMPVTNLSVSSIGSTGATLTWEGDADGYTIYNMADTSVAQTTSDPTAILTDLLPNTQYTFGVTSDCGGDESDFRTVSFTTLVSCPVPTNLTAILTPGDGSIATLTWHEIGTATNWQICLNGDTNNLIDVIDTTYDLTNLTPDTAYTAKVRAYCDVDDQSEWSNTITFTPTDSYTVTVNEGTTTNSYVPIYGYWCDNITKSQFIVPASNLAAMQFGIINKLTFYSSNSNVSWGAATFDVYVTETNETTLSELADYTSMTQVYAGSLSISNNKMEVNFTNPYQYLGGNLMIGFLQTASGTYSSCSWYGVSATGASMGGYGSSVSQRDFLPKMTIEFTPGEEPTCLPINNLTVSDITAHEATLNWQGEAGSYTIYNMSDSMMVATVNDTTYTLSNLASDSEHSFGVVANCGGEESIMRTITFTTEISCQVPTGLTVTYNPNDPTEVTLNWNENGTAEAWQICLNGDVTDLIDAYDTTHILTGLVPDTIYTAKVRAVCDVDDPSAWSGTISFEPSTKTVIGSGDATSSYLPTYCLYNYSLTQQIYTVAELGDAGLIESIDFYNDGTAERIRDLSVYIVSTPKDTFESATDWISVSAADLQFSGNVTFAPQAWTTIPLDGFAYDGLNNIAIIVDDNTGSWESSMSFRVFDAPSQALRIYSDGTNYDVNAPSYSGTVMDVKNQIRLVKGDLSGCLKPSGVTVNYLGGDEAIVTWSSDATSFNIDVNGVVTNNVTSPYTLSGLSLATIYTVSLQAVCDATSVSEWTNPINFTTDACLPTDQCTISIYAQDSYGDGWNGNTIHIIQNGVTVASYSMATQNLTNTPIYDTLQVNVCSGIPVDFAWESGSFAYETSFQILNGSDSVVYSVADGSTLSDTVFLTLSDACAGTTPTESLTIYLSINDPTLGTINPVPGTYVVALNDSLVLSATPAAGATFDGWKISVGTQTVGTIPINPFTIPVNSNNIAFGELNVVAMFSDSTSVPDSITVIVNTADATMGTTNPAPGTYHYAVGSQSFLAAIPNPGYHNLYWIEEFAIAGMVEYDTLYADTVGLTVLPIMAGVTVSITAYFEANGPGDYYNVSVTSANTSMGTVTSTASGSVAEGTQVTATATALEGYRFVNWTDAAGVVVSTANPYTFTVTADVTLIANFELVDAIEDITLAQSINLMPNPADNYIELRINSSVNVKEAVIYNAFGQMIQTVVLTDNHARIDLSNMASGMYFVRINGNNVTATKKFIKK